jgi:Helix-turn-helix domain
VTYTTAIGPSSQHIRVYFSCGPLISQYSTLMNIAPPEPFVDAVRAAAFLNLRTRRVLELARRGDLPGYPLGSGKRRVWRFRLSELAAAVSGMVSGR